MKRKIELPSSEAILLKKKNRQKLSAIEEFLWNHDHTHGFQEALQEAYNQGYEDARPKWLPIESAPKDGTWIRLWRKPEEYLIASPEIIARWVDFCEDGGAWVWPDDNYDPYTERGKSLAIDSINAGDYFYDESFTHWMPLPPPPTL